MLWDSLGLRRRRFGVPARSLRGAIAPPVSPRTGALHGGRDRVPLLHGTGGCGNRPRRGAAFGLASTDRPTGLDRAYGGYHPASVTFAPDPCRHDLQRRKVVVRGNAKQPLDRI